MKTRAFLAAPLALLVGCSITPEQCIQAVAMCPPIDQQDRDDDDDCEGDDCVDVGNMSLMGLPPGAGVVVIDKGVDIYDRFRGKCFIECNGPDGGNRAIYSNE